MWVYSFFRMGGDCVFVLAWLRVVFFPTYAILGLFTIKVEKPYIQEGEKTC